MCDLNALNKLMEKLLDATPENIEERIAEYCNWRSAYSGEGPDHGFLEQLRQFAQYQRH